MITERNHRGWGRETTPRGPCLIRQPIKNYGPALHVLGGVWRKVPLCLSLIGDPPDNILILLMALCRALSRNFPYIRTPLTLEYEIEFCLFLTRQSKIQFKAISDRFIPSLNIPKQHCHRCYEIAEGFQFMPLSLVRLRTFRLSTWVG